MARVTLEGVRKVYENGHVAVHGIDLDVADGEFVVLVGPSGCGKSTTLRMIAGLESSTAGRLSIGGEVVNEAPPRDRDIAMVFQNYALYPHMSVRENIGFGLKLRRIPRREIDERVRRVAAVLGIEEILHRRPGELSGGQRQRVAVGRAIVRQPKVFLFDEPLSNLDATLRVQMRAEIARLHRQLGATTIYVTHDQVEAMTLGDRIVVLRDGHVQQIDTPLNLYHRPANRFVAGFTGSPAMNFIEGTITREDGLGFRARDGACALPLGGVSVPGLDAYVGKGIVLGIRPEDVHLAGTPGLSGPAAVTTWHLDVVEPLGNEIFLYACNQGHRVVARVAPHTLPVAGRAIALAFRLDKLHFFDPETDRAIGAADRAAAAR